MSQEIASLSGRVEELIEQDGSSAETVRAVAECLADLVRLPEYRQTVDDLLGHVDSDEHALALVDQIKRDIPVLEPLEYSQLGVYLRKIGADYFDLSAVYLVLGPNWITLGQPRLEAEAHGLLH